MTYRTCISLGLAFGLALQSPGILALAQTETPRPTKLQLVIVEGEGAINNIKQRVAREPVVEVQDENRKPVAGAAVVFTLPSNGASGVFADGSRILTVVTGEDGRAVARGLQPNNVSGKMQIRVTASNRGVSTSATISQVNSVAGAAAGAGAGGAAMGAGKIIAILAVVGGAAAAGTAVAVTRGGNGPAPVPQVSITPGNPRVDPPR